MTPDLIWVGECLLREDGLIRCGRRRGGCGGSPKHFMKARWEAEPPHAWLRETLLFELARPIVPIRALLGLPPIRDGDEQAALYLEFQASPADSA